MLSPTASSPSARAPRAALSADEQSVVQQQTADMSPEARREFTSSVAFAKELMMRAPEDQPTREKRSVSTVSATHTLVRDDNREHSSFWSRSFAGDGNLAIVLESIKKMRGTLVLPPACGQLKRMPPKFLDTLATKHIEAMKRKNVADIPPLRSWPSPTNSSTIAYTTWLTDASAKGRSTERKEVGRRRHRLQTVSHRSEAV